MAVLDFYFSGDPALVDRELVHQWLSEQSYWARGRTRATQDAAVDGSRSFGVYEVTTDRQLAYARVVTDGATFAWICDVFVGEGARGSGAGKLLMAGIVAEFAPLGLKRMLLATADAHGLYEQYGFSPLRDPSMWMERATTAERAD
jgi:GNAT superfamily N-acetyltransferase